MDNTQTEEYNAFIRGVRDCRAGRSGADEKIEELKRLIRKMFEAIPPEFTMEQVEKWKKEEEECFQKVHKLEELRRVGMEMATVYPDLSEEELQFKYELERIEEEFPRESDPENVPIRRRRTERKLYERPASIQEMPVNNEQIVNSVPYTKNNVNSAMKRNIRFLQKIEGRTSFNRRLGAGALAIAILAGGTAMLKKQNTQERLDIEYRASMKNPEPTPIEPMTPPVVQNSMRYTTLEQWYQEKSKEDLEFKQIFEKYFTSEYKETVKYTNNLAKKSIPEIEEALENLSSYEIAEGDRKMAETEMLLTGASTMENFTRDLVKYIVKHAITQEQIPMESLVTTYSQNHTVNYKPTVTVRTEDKRYSFKNGELPKEIQRLIKGNGIVELSDMQQDSTYYLNKLDERCDLMKRVWTELISVANKEYIFQEDKIVENAVQKEIEEER